MTRLRQLGACLALCGAILVPWNAAAEVGVEETVQYALENLVSGTASNTSARGTEIAVTPLRTWKSVSGHWCRRYELTVTQPGAAPDRTEATRCRQDGVWKRLPEE